jgi:hypothetical protein
VIAAQKRDEEATAPGNQHIQHIKTRCESDVILCRSILWRVYIGALKSVSIFNAIRTSFPCQA